MQRYQAHALCLVLLRKDTKHTPCMAPHAMRYHGLHYILHEGDSSPCNYLPLATFVTIQHSLVADGANRAAVLRVARVLALVGPALVLAVVAADGELLHLALLQL
jgi:hypothetical protein